MQLTIDGRLVTAQTNRSLYDITRDMGLFCGKLSEDPLAAMIAGRVFTLQYVPVRDREVNGERGSIRRAMAASEGKVTLLRYRDPAGREAYIRTAQFVLFLAIRRLYPEARAKMTCTIGQGMYIRISGVEDLSVDRLSCEVDRLIAEDFPLTRRRITTQEAIALFESRGQADKARLLAYREKPTLDIYEYGDFADYFYGEMMPTTGFLKRCLLHPAPEGVIYVLPDPCDPDARPTYHMDSPNFLFVYAEGKRWGELMGCETVADLNGLVESGRVRELIRVNEALHEKRFSAIADMICERGARAVLVSGPSSSGKTTSANRLATQLRVHGRSPILMSLDDYYIDRDKIPLAEDGTQDLEHINTIDTALFAEHLTALLRGETVELPSFDFRSGKREWRGHTLCLAEDSVVIIEGLHALNPTLLPAGGIDPHLLFRMYVSPMIPLNLDDHNRIPTGFLRLLRRTVRDHATRGASVKKTLSMWESVRRGEVRWIYPYQEKADVIFNSSTLYEPAVLKKYIYPLLLEIQPGEEYYDQVRGMVKVLNFIKEADVDDEIPPTSLVREFIGGNSFYR